MYFWFSRDTFSIFDAILKLVVVIIGSVIIICFCHRVTNYKKTRRYKYDFVRQHLGEPESGQFRSSQQHQQQQQHRWLDRSVLEANGSAFAYDPYNTIRPLGGGGGPSGAFFNNNQAILTGQSFQLPLAAGGAFANYHHPQSALAAYQSLAALNLAQQQQQQQMNNSDATAADGTNSATAGGRAQTQVYSGEMRPDFWGFQASQLEADESACPSYEEAIRDSAPATAIEATQDSSEAVPAQAESDGGERDTGHADCDDTEGDSAACN